MNSFKLGIIAEYIVLVLYLVRFYRILFRRYKTGLGEIDLIVVKGKTLVFIEVKARKCGLHEGIVSNQQIRRIKNTAELFLSKNSKYQKYNIRFDFALITPYKLPVIIQNCWD
jgi:putative endonuclease